MDRREEFSVQREGYVDVVAGIVLHEGKAFGAERSYGDYEGFWEYPGGKVEPHESFTEALVREFQEELEVALCPEDLTYLETFYHEYPQIKISLHLYLIEGPLADPVLHVHHQARWFGASDINTVKWLESTHQINQALVERGIIT